MQLLKEILELDQELDKVLLGEGNTLAINSLELVYTNMIPSLDGFESALSSRRIYEKLPGNYAIVDQSNEEIELIQQACTAVMTFLTKWEKLEKKHTISQDDICGNTRDSVLNLTNVLNTRNSTKYRAWTSQIVDEVSVSDSELEQQENSPNLKTNALQFRTLYQKFCEEIDSKSPTLKTISNLEGWRNKLVELKEKMEFNQPEDVVKLFKYLKQVGNNARAPLSMLTPEVLEWMSKQDQESYFYVGDSRISNRGW